MSSFCWLTDALMPRLRPFFPKSRRRVRIDDWHLLSRIVSINHDGMRPPNTQLSQDVVQLLEALERYGDIPSYHE